MDAILTDMSTELTWTMMVRVTILLIYSPVCSLSIGLIGHDSIKDYKSSSLESVLYLPHFSPLLHECSFESSIQHRSKQDIAQFPYSNECVNLVPSDWQASGEQRLNLDSLQTARHENQESRTERGRERGRQREREREN